MKTISSIREFICFNQKELIKYEFLLSEKHKELRLLLEKDSSKNIINERENGKFTDPIDFIVRMSNKGINKKTISNLFLVLQLFQLFGLLISLLEKMLFLLYVLLLHQLFHIN